MDGICIAFLSASVFGARNIALPANERNYGTNMVIGLLQARLSLPQARSLKDKRQVIKSLKDKARQRVNVSVAEVDHQDFWQSAALAFVTVAAEHVIVDQRLSEIQELLRSDPRAVLLDVHTEIL